MLVFGLEERGGELADRDEGEDIPCCVDAHEDEGDTADCSVDVDIVVMSQHPGGKEDR